jgi:hypothetical protein
MTDFVKAITEVWNEEGIQAAYDRGTKCLETIAEEIRGLQSQRTTVTALIQHLEASGARTTPQLELFESVRVPDRPQVILDAAAAVVEVTSHGSVVNVQEVLAELQRRNLNLGVKQPLAVIGTVLSRSEYYDKLARNTFLRVEPLRPM